MIFRQATHNDLPALLALEQAVVEAERPFNDAIKPNSATYYDLPDLIDSEQSLLLVAEQKGEVVATGYGQIRPSKASLVHESHCYLGFMFVAPHFRGKGLNQQILDKLIAWSKNLDVNHFYLDVYAQNHAAIRAYEKAGFTSNMIEMKLNL